MKKESDNLRANPLEKPLFFLELIIHFKNYHYEKVSIDFRHFWMPFCTPCADDVTDDITPQAVKTSELTLTEGENVDDK